MCADVVFTEIMYDVAGGDDGKEWVELYNQGNVDIDVTTLRFTEGGVNHKIIAVDGAMLPPGEYAIIADNVTAFTALYPSFTGLLFDSSFSLSNAGESLMLKSGDVVMDTVAYVPDEGANGTGFSLQKMNASWVAATPSPGYAAGVSGSPPSASVTTQTTESSPSTVVGGEPPADPVAPRIHVSIKTDSVINAGTPTRFEGAAFVGGVPAPDTARFLWNFGDGAIFIGRNTMHTYMVPGHYVASLTVSMGDASETHMMPLDVFPATVSIAAASPGIDGGIVLRNEGSRMLNISMWYARAAGSTFVFPAGTYLAPGVDVFFSNRTTRLLFDEGGDVALHIPTGSPVAVIDSVQNKRESMEIVTLTRDTARSENVLLPKESEQEGKVSQDHALFFTTSTVGAAVHESVSPSDDGAHVWWYATFIGVLVVASYGAVLLEKRRPVDEFEIIDAHDES